MKKKSILYLSIVVINLFLSKLTFSQCPTTIPNGTDNCALAEGSVELGANGSSGFFNWYDALTGGNFLGSGNTFNTPHLTTTTTYYVSATKENIGLDFDGIDDRIDLGNPAKLQITGDMTIEMWIKPNNFSSRKNPFAKAYGGEGTITQEPSGTLSYYYGTNGGNGTPYQGFSSGTILTAGEWTHIAIVRDLTNMQLHWYINGVQSNQVAANFASATAGANPIFIGDGYVNNYDGKIDELRIWNTARTQAEIDVSKNICLIGNEAGLVSYYQFNDGAGTQLLDLTVPTNHGTLTNMNSTTDWVSTDFNYNCIACESARTPVIATVMNGTPLNLGTNQLIDCGLSLTLDAGSGHANYLWNTGETSQTITSTLSGLHWVEVDNGSGCSDSDTIRVEISSGSKNALDFNGTNQSISVGNKSSLQITGDLTIEMWIKPDNFSSRKNPYAKSYGGEGTITQEVNGTYNFYYGTNGGNAHPYQGFNSSIPSALNEWTHIALVRDLTNMQLNWYINGILTNQAIASFPSSALGSNPVLIANGYTNEFDGQIDELRVWNTARTETQIREKMCSKINTVEPNLQLYYRFDEGTGSTLTDLSQNKSTSTLINSPAWVTSSASIGDRSDFIYTNSWGGQSLNHSVCSGENLTLRNITGTPDGIHIYSIGSIPNDITGIIGLGSNNRYFGVHKINDNTATYDAIYDYALNPHVDIANDVNLLLFKRSDNAATPWVNTGVSPNITTNSITATASSTEFILGSSLSPLPVELTHFNVIENNGFADIYWSTESELNNDYFIIEKSQNGVDWRELTQVTGTGNSSELTTYFEVDENPFNRISYYRLIQVDFDGEKTYGPKASLNIETEDITVFPNPFKNEINITNLTDKNHIQVYAMDGKLMFEGYSSTIDTYEWISGLYELIIFNQDNSIVDRFKIVK